MLVRFCSTNINLILLCLVCYQNRNSCYLIFLKLLNLHVKSHTKPLFSSPELKLKAQLSFSDRLLSFVRPSIPLTVCSFFRLSLNFSHFHLLLKNKTYLTKSMYRWRWFELLSVFFYWLYFFFFVDVVFSWRDPILPRGDRNGIGKIRRRIFFKNSPKPLGLFQQNLTQSIIFVYLKRSAFFKGKRITH